MNTRKLMACLMVCLMTTFLAGTAIANEVESRTVTQDMTITANQNAGGIGYGRYQHYGNYQFDGRAFLENTGTRTFEYTLKTASGKLVYSGTLTPGQSMTMPLLQSVLQWELSDGAGEVRIATLDGGDGQAYFRYNVLD